MFIWDILVFDHYCRVLFLFMNDVMENKLIFVTGGLTSIQTDVLQIR